MEQQINDKTPFYVVRKKSTGKSSSGLSKKIKKCKKDIKELKCKKKVKKSLDSFLGDKVKYNIAEMISDVKQGLKNDQTEEQFCSLMSVVKHQPITGRIIRPFPLGQLSGFRLFPGSSPFNDKKDPDTGSDDSSNKNNSFKVPLPPTPRRSSYRGRGRGRGRPPRNYYTID